MIERIAELILDESKWLAVSMLAAGLAVVVWISRRRRRQSMDRRAVLGVLNRFYGGVIGLMTCGHLLAVTVKGLRGTLQGSPWFLYPLGLALAIPAWALFLGVDRLASGEQRWNRATAALNVWIGLTLLALGLLHFPLAAPAALNLAYQFHTRRAVGWTILTVAVVANLLLFVGSLVFLASGQSFEEFSGM